MTPEQRRAQHDKDQVEWERIMASREAARRRNTFSAEEVSQMEQRAAGENAVAE